MAYLSYLLAHHEQLAHAWNMFSLQTQQLCTCHMYVCGIGIHHNLPEVEVKRGVCF